MAEELAGDFADGVCFVTLAPVREPDLVISTIVRALGLRELGESPLFEWLVGYLKERELLLLLDNFEQVVEAAPRVAELVAICPHLKVLTTSREVLHLSCERVFPVPPLGLPDVEELPEDIGTLSGYEAVEFFVDRARAAKPDFRLGAQNAPAVAAICARLDGLPLGIQLAAARIRLLSPQEILERLRRRLRLLKGGPRDAPSRQKTLRDAIEWSYDLLGAEERSLFKRLSVFAGGCTLEAAEAVCNAEQDLAEEVLDVLGSLMDKSLLLRRAETEAGEGRFWMLQTVKEYALERLEAEGEEEEVRRAHAAHYLALVEEARPELQGPRQAEWFDRLEAEHDNLRAALSWSLERGDAETALQMNAELWWFWYKRGHLSEGRRWLEAALENSMAPISARAEALNGAGVLARNQSDYERAREWLEESLLLRRELGDVTGTADVLVNLGTVALDRGDYPRARALFDESLSLRRESGDRWGTALALNNLGATAQAQGNLAEALPLCEESLKLFRALGDKAGIAMVLSNLGEVVEEEGEYARATAFYQESLALYREVGDKACIALLSCSLGSIARLRADHARAAALYEEGLLLYKELGSKLGIAQALEGMATVRGACGQPGPATRLWSAAEALREEIGASPPDPERARREPVIATARKALGEQAFANAWSEGRRLTPEQVLDGWWEQAAVDPGLARLAGLTAGEIKVLRLVASGKSNAQVAEKLFISRRTVDAHLRSIYRKLGVDSRTAAARHATERGLV